MTSRTTPRQPADRRRQILIEATAAVLAEQGAAGLSVRAVAAAAGVSPGLVGHYFDGIDALAAATYAQTAEHVQATLESALDAAGPDPRARLMAYVTASFAPAIADGALLATWLGFWSLVKSNPSMALIHARIYARFREVIEGLVAECGGGDDPRLAAVGIGAVVDGLWLELSLDPASFSRADACAIAERTVAALVAPPQAEGAA